MNDPSTPQGQIIAESRIRREQQRQEIEQYSAEEAAKQKAYKEAQADYYRAIREENGVTDWNLSDKALDFIAAAQPAVNTAEDKQYMKERIAAADMYSDLFNVSFENAFLNLDNFHQQYMGKQFTKKDGVQAVADSVKLSFLSREYNELTKKLAKQGGTDPDLLQAVQEYEQKLDKLRDHAPKVWQDDYVSMGGWDDVGQFIRSVGTSLGENAVPILEGMGWATLAATGVGAFGASAGLSTIATKILVAGASRLAIAGSTYNSSWGMKYREMTNQGIPHDIAMNYARMDAAIEGIIEGSLGGIEAAGADAIMRTVVPETVGRSATRLFINNGMARSAKAVLNALKEGFEEGSEELLQGTFSGAVFNDAAEKANKQRIELLEKIAAEPFEEIRKDLEKELEKHPEVDKKKWNDIFNEAKDGAIAGFLTGLILGIPVEIINTKHDIKSAMTLAAMAKEAPNAAVFIDMVETAKANGMEFPVLEGLKTDEVTDILTDIQKVQWERMTPEEREAKQKEIKDAEALAEVTDYSHSELAETEDEETKEKSFTLIPQDMGETYSEDGQLYIQEYTDTKEDGSINGRYVAGDPRIEDEEKSGANQYGYINYTQNGNDITIDDFKMLSGYENLRADLYQQFAEKHAGENIVWNPKNEQNIALRDELIQQNPRGIKQGLNFYENADGIKISNEARQVAQRFQPYLKNSTPLETALAAELFNNFYRHRGENLSGAMNRLLGNVTNKPTDGVIAAQNRGLTVKGGTWLDRTAEGMKHFVYLNKHAADASTVIHETGHIIEADFTDAERNIAIDALDGYTLKNGTIFNNDKNTPFAKWTREQHETFSEAFAEALENYLTNGTAPNEQIKSLFEKIKEFMKRIYKTFTGWTELSPQVEEFYKSLLSGELVDQARAETTAQTSENSHSEAQKEKTINDTETADNAIEAQQERTTENSHTTTPDHFTEQREKIINDPNIPLEDKTQSIMDLAEDAIWQTGIENMLFQIIGEKGAELLDKAEEATTRIDSLNFARQSEKEGKDAKTIHIVTGWERGADGKWRYEIPDGKIKDSGIDKLAENQMKGYTPLLITLQELYDNEKLYEAYPDLRNYTVEINTAAMAENRGSFNKETKTIKISANTLHEENREITLIHEIQHAIQKIEGFAEGSSTELWQNLLYENRIEKYMKHEKEIKGIKEKIKEIWDSHTDDRERRIYLGYEEGIKKIRTSSGDVIEYGLLQDSTEITLKDFGYSVEKFEEYSRLESELNKYIQDYDPFEKPFDLYHRTAGEVEARNVQKRMGFKSMQRFNTMLAETEDVAREDQIIIQDGKAAINMLFQTAYQANMNVDYKFDNSDIHRDIIKSQHGWGHRFHSQKEVAEYYKKAMPKYVEGQLYHVEIPDDEELLHWDKPISEQAKVVQQVADKLITWDRDGKSRFKPEFNIRKFDDGTFGFIKSINGKVKWETIKEAKAAAREEIKKTLTGKEFYNTLSKSIGEKETSLLLDHLGVRGTKYFEKKHEKIGAEKGYNYVIFGDSSIDIKNTEGEKAKYIFYFDNALTTSQMLFQTAEDTEYFKAIETGDMEKAQKIVDAQARKNGYISTDEYRLMHQAPNRGDYQLSKIMESGIVPDDYWTHPKYYQYENYEYESFYNIKSALNTYKEKGRASIWVYRSVPKNIREDSFRNGDWVTPSRRVAEMEGEVLVEGYRIIAKKVNIEKLWWDGNAITEFGYDDGKDYVYKNTKNNRKLFDTIVRDYEGNIVPPSKRFNFKMSEIYFQFGDKEMIEEAATFEDGKDYRGFVDLWKEDDAKYDGWEDTLRGLSEEQIDAWYDKFVEKSKQAVNAGEETQQIDTEKKLTPAELDKEFNEMISEKGKLEEFVKYAAKLYNEGGRFGAVYEEEAEKIELIRRELKHPDWTMVFDAKGEFKTEQQRKKLLSLIKKAPRDYRAIYAEIMEREDLAVSAEDRTAEILKYKITDSRREEIDSMTPEQLRKFTADIADEELRRKLKNGRSEIKDPVVIEHIKRLNEKIKQDEKKIDEINKDRDEDNKYIERLAGTEFLKTFDRAAKAHAYLTRRHEKLDRAIKDGEKDVSNIARQLQRENASYNSIMKTLQEMADAHQLELDIQKAFSDEELKSYVKSARTQATMERNDAEDELMDLKKSAREQARMERKDAEEELKDYVKSARTQATMERDELKNELKSLKKSAREQASLLTRLVRKATLEEYKSHLAELKEQQQIAKDITKAKSNVIKRTFRRADPREVDAGYGMKAAAIQRFAYPSFEKTINEFMGEIEKTELRPVFEVWKFDERLRNDLLKDKNKNTKKKMNNLFGKEKFEDLTEEEKKYLSRKIAPVDWVKEFDLKEIAERREMNYPITENERLIVQQILPPDVYYRIMDKPFSQWTLTEAEELAKIIDDLIVQGKQIYKANLDAEKRRISAYQTAVRNTIRTVIKKGQVVNDNDEIEKILNKHDEGFEGTAEAESLRRKLRGKFPKYADMNIYRFARMLDNGDTNGKNSAALYRMARDAQNNELIAKDIRREKVLNRMKELGIKTDELWHTVFDLGLGKEKGKFTAWELIGFSMAIRDDYSRAAVLGGNMLFESERVEYQGQGITPEEITELELIAGDRFEKVNTAAQKLLAEHPEYQQIIDVLDEDYAESGKRTGDALIRYNNTFMDTVKYYFPMQRTEAISAKATKEVRELMGSSAGAFTLFVEKGFAKGRVEIPIQFQRGIKLDAFAVWAEAVEKEEHFIAYAQPVKDLNKIYKQSRPVMNAIQLRYGRDAVEYINKYINELANPEGEKIKDDLSGFIKNMRGNAAAAYLSFNVTSIIKQGITSPAPFFAYMNPIQYSAAQIEFTTHYNKLWQEIQELSPYMKHRSANMMVELLKERERHIENKLDAAISKVNKKGMWGLEMIDRACVAPGWLVLYRKEQQRLTKENNNGSMSMRDIKVKAAQYADDIVSITQPSGYTMDTAKLFKGNNELGKAYLQFTQSLSNIWQNIRYDMPQMIRDKRFKNAAGTIIGYTIAGILLGYITAGFNDDDDDKTRAAKIAWWATLQFTDAFPVIGSEATQLAELLFTGKTSRNSGANLVPAFEKGYKALQAGISAAQQKEFEKNIKAMAQAGGEALMLYHGIPLSGVKTIGRTLGIGDGDGELNFKPGAIVGRR